MSSRRPSELEGLLEGVLVVDKPEKMTSARVVDAVKKALGVRRAGHTGTLDPMATGVLPICLGAATRLATFLLADDKTYTGEITLGVTTDSHDADGKITGGDAGRAESVTREALLAAMAALTGEILQTPPMVSALRRGGQRLHEIARAGGTVELEARPVRVETFALESFAAGRLAFLVRCTKGTYVRALARDLGEALGCGAHLSRLRRTKAGVFCEAQAVEIAALDRQGAAAHLITPAAALAHLPVIAVGEALVGRIRNGLNLRFEQLEAATPPPNGLFALHGPGGQLLAVTRVEAGLLAYERVFLWQS